MDGMQKIANADTITGKGIRFERVRRVTGYLSNLNRFNNGKAAEERDRLKHMSMTSWKGEA